MSDDHERDAAAEAFTGLQASVERQGEEIVLLRRAIEGMAAARAEMPELPELPDYSETLARQLQGNAILMREVAALQKLPALDMTPEQMAARITAAGASARSDDRALIAEARRALDDISRSLHGHIKEARGVAAQKRALIQIGLGGLAAGALLWSVLPGFVARNVAPASWHWPEKLAQRSLGAGTMWDGARQMAAAGSPATWNIMVEGAALVQANQAVLGKCRKEQARLDRPVACTIMTGAADAGDER